MQLDGGLEKVREKVADWFASSLHGWQPNFTGCGRTHSGARA